MKLVSGASYIYREQQQRYLPIKFSVRDRDLGGAILEAQSADRGGGEAAARLPHRIGGRVRESEGRDRAPLVMVPIAFALIALLLYSTSARSRDTLLALSVIPLAMTGGILRSSLPASRSASRPRSASSRCSASR